MSTRKTAKLYSTAGLSVSWHKVLRLCRELIGGYCVAAESKDRPVFSFTKKAQWHIVSKVSCVACLVFLVAVVGFEHMVAIDARVGLA